MSKRIKAFLLHLLISSIIALCIIALVFLCWYPTPLAKAVGVTQIFLMLIAIDVIIGPLLTLLVYKEGKKTLKMDLIVIILLQVLALCYGLYNLYEGKPAWIVQHGDRFELIRNNDIIRDKIDSAEIHYQQTSWLKPQIVAVAKSTTIEQQNKLFFEEMNTGISASFRPERYTAIENVANYILEKARPIAELNKFNEQSRIDAELKKHPRVTKWMPLRGIDVDMVVLIDGQGEVVKIVDLRPWN